MEAGHLSVITMYPRRDETDRSEDERRAEAHSRPPPRPPATMMSTKPDSDPLAREQLQIEKRRARLEERRQRILNGKQRLKGIDREGIERQIREKREKAEAERRAEMEEAEALKRAVESVDEQERRARATRKARVADHRTALQKQAERRAAEVGESRESERVLKKTSLDFAGEDEGKGARVRAQAKQQRSWIRAQLKEREGRQRTERERMQAEAEELARVTSIAEGMELQSRRARASNASSVAQYNLEQARIRTEAERRAAAADAETAKHEIEQQIAAGARAEDKAAARAIPSEFRGFTAEERQRILAEQAAQIEERRRRMEEQRLAEEQEYEAGLAVQRELSRRERLVKEQKAALRRNVADEQQRLSAEHAEKERHLNRDVYANEVTDDFYAQFGTSAR